jgi:hypothetical protein
MCPKAITLQEIQKQYDLFIYLILTTQNIKSRCEQNLKSNDANWNSTELLKLLFLRVQLAIAPKMLSFVPDKDYIVSHLVMAVTSIPMLNTNQLINLLEINKKKQSYLHKSLSMVCSSSIISTMFILKWTTITIK